MHGYMHSYEHRLLQALCDLPTKTRNQQECHETLQGWCHSKNIIFFRHQKTYCWLGAWVWYTCWNPIPLQGFQNKKQRICGFSIIQITVKRCLFLSKKKWHNKSNTHKSNIQILLHTIKENICSTLLKFPEKKRHYNILSISKQCFFYSTRRNHKKYACLRL